MISLVDAGFVRSVGSFPASTAAGTVTDSQLSAAIILAVGRMMEVVGISKYAAVQGWNGTSSPTPSTIVLTMADGSTLTMADKLERFKQAEACFAIGRLPYSVSSSQTGETGIKQSVETAKARTDFASMEEGRKDRQAWDDQAFRWLAPFLAGQALDADKIPIGFRNRRKTFFITSCSSPEDPTS